MPGIVEVIMRKTSRKNPLPPIDDQLTDAEVAQAGVPEASAAALPVSVNEDDLLEGYWLFELLAELCGDRPVARTAQQS
jgi:hypothetical protein